MSKVGINGFGRIGRLVLRRLLEVKIFRGKRKGQKSLSNVLAFIPPPINRRRILMLVRRRC